MKRTAVAFSVLAALGGCVSTEGGRYMGENWGAAGAGGCGSSCPPSALAGVQGPYGAPVHSVGAGPAPTAKDAALATFAANMPPELVQQVAYKGNGIMPMAAPMPPGLMPPGMPGVMAPGMAGPMGPGMPGMAGAMAPGMPGMMGPPPGAGGPGAYTSQFAASRSSLRFTGDPEIYGMKVSWYTSTSDGKRAFSQTPLEVPGRYNFAQGAIYRLKLSDIPGFPAEEFYPTLEVVPANAKTATFLAHSSVPVTFTKEDFRTVVEGNYLVKVVYLPDPQFQDVAITGTGELISTQLEPGVDPIAEACKRGSILAVLRLGNIRLEEKHTPAMDAPPPGGAAMLPPGALPPGANGMLPPGAMPPDMRGGMAGPMRNPGALPPGVPPMVPGRNPILGGLPAMPPAAPAPAPTPSALPPLPTTVGPGGQLPNLPPLPPTTGPSPRPAGTPTTAPAPAPGTGGR